MHAWLAAWVGGWLLDWLAGWLVAVAYDGATSTQTYAATDR